MKKLIILTFIVTFINTKGNSQNKYAIPKGYEIVVDSKLRQIRVDKDFDLDGTKDTFIILKETTKKNGNVIANFSSKKQKEYFFTYIPLNAPKYYFEIVKNIINIHCGTEGWEVHKILKFRFNSDLNDYELIGYEENMFSKKNYGHSKTVNFLNGKYAIKKNSWKKEMIKTFEQTLISMNNIDEIKLDQLTTIGSEYLLN